MANNIKQQARKEMDVELGLRVLRNRLSKMGSETGSKPKRLVAELAKMQVDHIDDMYKRGVVSEADIKEMIINPEKTKQIMGNT